MNGRIIMSLLSERQDGPIGDDWRYDLQAKVFHGALADEGTIHVPKHKLSSGCTQSPPGPPEPVILNTGVIGDDVLVRLHLDATEVDLFVNDHGCAELDVPLHCPRAGELPVTRDVEVSVGVMESPGWMGETSVFRLRLRLMAECA
ncbi:hypothetical protein F3N42_14030 [Marinihelvus fidelis]|uniref:Uncharacterized protein n=1 Tax=Marinihelvus fidelis TaxID=2613842 RepID=A0A5N0T3X5_9GAMM|nr:hypothetical protein [Marinihelvus fidelis]KAA9129770.1 hypothetical protein F3N42_14030 [Marinihelvus fidelis]